MRFIDIKDQHLIDLISQQLPNSNGEASFHYVCKQTAYTNLKAENDPVYSQYPITVSKTVHNSDKKSAKIYQLSLFLFKTLKRLFCHYFSLLAPLLLDFRPFFILIVECQNNYPLTMSRQEYIAGSDFLPSLQ